MLVLLINLARRPDHLAFVRNQLDALGIAFERIDAIDGRAVDVGPGTDLISPVERACALSHRKAWMRFLDSDASHCLILEDDVLIAPQMKRFVEDPRAFPAGTEILRLETRLQECVLGRGRRCGPPGFRAHPLLSRHHGCAGYIITRAFAERAVRDLTAFVEPVDEVLFEPKSPNYYPNVSFQLRPGVCLQAELYEPAQSTAIARSDLEMDRRVRFPRHEPAPRIRVQRSLPEKCLREAARWWRRTKAKAEFLHARFIVGRVLRDVPFAGGTLPAAAAALSVSGSEQALQPEVQALRFLATDR
ncbi:glycosyltransferase family 25 protein [Xanthobacter oligotrophicus]|uniref:glycosyltransferase family 25 protein n=1 Tax=Xanthobacter oligotrophicus TaxID=2607286 RepID=UPI0011F40606|nr:glycosyltransferase family 25 protein [Xanthobacter oligotrophicus]MCG5235044.1 glycosyltransferase family 25 protein [Xanthobacter oligotrophicus]